MCDFKVTATLILTAALASTTANAEIYKWTDDDGNVHYTDTPMIASSQRVNIDSKATDNAQVTAQVQARLERQAVASTATAQTGLTAAEMRAEKQARSEKCSKYRERLTRYVQTRHLYREDENGERVYLDESEMDQARSKVEGQVQEYCN
jgi:hypothetical protein